MCAVSSHAHLLSIPHTLSPCCKCNKVRAHVHISRACSCTHTHTLMLSLSHTHTCTHVHTHVHTCDTHVHTRAHAYTHARTCTHTHTLFLSLSHTHTLTHTHIHTRRQRGAATFELAQILGPIHQVTIQNATHWNTLKHTQTQCNKMKQNDNTMKYNQTQWSTTKHNDNKMKYNGTQWSKTKHNDIRSNTMKNTMPYYAIHCNALHLGPIHWENHHETLCSVMQCVAACCSVLQYGACLFMR